MIDSIDSTWHVEPFNLEAWLAFSKRDRFLAFQQRDMLARCERLAGGGMGTVEGLLAKYLEAQYNGCHEDSLLARKWNAFAKQFAKREKFAIGDRVRLKVQGAAHAMVHGVVVWHHNSEHDPLNPRVRWASGWGVTSKASELVLLTDAEKAALTVPTLCDCDVPRPTTERDPV